MQSNDIFKPGTKVQWIIHQGTDMEEAEEILASTKHLLRTSPIITQGPGVGSDVKLIDIRTEVSGTLGGITMAYRIIGIGVVV